MCVIGTTLAVSLAVALCHRPPYSYLRGGEEMSRIDGEWIVLLGIGFATILCWGWALLQLVELWGY